MELNDFVYSISSSYVVIILFLIFILIFLFQNLYFKTKFGYKKYQLNKLNRNKEKGYGSFVSGMIALANKDYRKAISESKKISNFLNDTPALSLLLRSEVYKIEKKYDDLNDIYEEMSKDKITEDLAYRGMMEQYLRSHDYHHAYIYGEKLFNKNPYIEKIYDALVNITVKTHNWQQLIIISKKAFSKKIIDKKIYEDNSSIGLFEIAKIKQFSEINESLNLIQKALVFRKNFPPYVKLYLEILIQNKNYKRAKKYLKNIWNEKPHSEYKDIIKTLASCLNMDYLDLVKYIISSNSIKEESKILMVEASITNGKWDLARNEIKSLLDVEPKKEICLLMAKIEEGDTGDSQKINSWKLRARNGLDQNMWFCIYSNQTQNLWTSVSKAGYFNSLEWRQPNMLNQYNSQNQSISYDN